jgi:hypothetical protein
MCRALICLIKGSHTRSTLNCSGLKNVVYGDGGCFVELVKAASLLISLFYCFGFAVTRLTALYVMQLRLTQILFSCVDRILVAFLIAVLFCTNKTVLFTITLSTFVFPSTPIHFIVNKFSIWRGGLLVKTLINSGFAACRP